jgi:hypothetical protein
MISRIDGAWHACRHVRRSKNMSGMRFARRKRVSCHVPFMAQGAAQAIEDRATLSTSLANINTRHVPEALNRYDQFLDS